MKNKKIYFYFILIFIFVILIGLFVYQNKFAQAQQQGGSSNFLYNSPQSVPPNAQIRPFGFGGGGGESVFKDEVNQKGVISFPKDLGLDFEPIILHGSGAQVIGRNAYLNVGDGKWKYYKDGLAYIISWGGGNETSNPPQEWTYMKFSAAGPGTKDSDIVWNDSFSISPSGNLRIFKNLIFNDGIVLTQSNNNLNLNLAGGELVISQNFSGAQGITLKLASSSNNAWSNTPFLNFYDERTKTKFGIRSDKNGFYFGRWKDNIFVDFLVLEKSGKVLIPNNLNILATKKKFLNLWTPVNNKIFLGSFSNLLDFQILNYLYNSTTLQSYLTNRLTNCDTGFDKECESSNWTRHLYLEEHELFEKYDIFIELQNGQTCNFSNCCSSTTCNVYAQKYETRLKIAENRTIVMKNDQYIQINFTDFQFITTTQVICDIDLQNNKKFLDDAVGYVLNTYNYGGPFDRLGCDINYNDDNSNPDCPYYYELDNYSDTVGYVNIVLVTPSYLTRDNTCVNRGGRERLNAIIISYYLYEKLPKEFGTIVDNRLINNFEVYGNSYLKNLKTDNLQTDNLQTNNLRINNLSTTRLYAQEITTNNLRVLGSISGSTSSTSSRPILKKGSFSRSDVIQGGTHLGDLPSGNNENNCIVFLKGFKNVYSFPTQNPTPIIGAQCWLIDNKIYGSITGQQTSNMIGSIECGYLCW